MGNFDRQIANVLARMHRQTRGGDGSCRWYYSGKLDLYHCPHTAIYGKDLMLEIPEWNDFNSGRNAALDAPHEEHNL